MCGLAGREIAGRRVGLIAALLTAIYPNIWLNDELASSEALSPLCVALIFWTTYRFWKKPTGWNVAALGAEHRLCRLVPRRTLAAGPSHHGSDGPARPFRHLAPTCRAPGHRRRGCGPPGVPLGGLQLQSIPRPGLHQRRPGADVGLGQLRHHLLGDVRGILVSRVHEGRQLQVHADRRRVRQLRQDRDDRHEVHPLPRERVARCDRRPYRTRLWRSTTLSSR